MGVVGLSVCISNKLPGGGAGHGPTLSRRDQATKCLGIVITDGFILTEFVLHSTFRDFLRALRLLTVFQREPLKATSLCSVLSKFAALGKLWKGEARG